MADTLVDRLKAARDRSASELDTLGEGFEDLPAPPAAPSAPVRQPQERIGVGRNLVDETTRVIITGLDARIAAAKKAGNAKMIAELKARKKAILDEAQLAKK
jgi:hypothetical protein